MFLRFSFGMVLGLSILLSLSTNAEEKVLKTSKYVEQNLTTYEFDPSILGYQTTQEIETHDLSIRSKSKFSIQGSYTSFLRPECHYTRLKSLVRQDYFQTSDMAEILQPWFQDCDEELSRFNTSSILDLLNFQFVSYPLSKNPHLKSVVFEYDNGLKIRGILGIRDQVKRPLVIIRNGVYGNASESAVSKNLLMHLFDESPFHILFLGNLTGDQFIKDNGILAMGGFDEGRQFHKIIDQMQNSQFKDYIEDIHIVGASLGGNGALFSGLYDSYAETPRIKSIVAMCPVVHLENSLNNVFSGSIVGKAYSLVTYSLVKDVFQFVPLLGELLPRDEKWSLSEITQAVQDGAIQYYKDRTEETPWDMAPFNGVVIQDKQQFWDLNDFTKYADQVRTPTLVLHARDDFIVPSKINSHLLLEKTQNKHSNVGVVEFRNGSHCAFNIANGWPTYSNLLREFILKNSSYSEPREIHVAPLAYEKSPKKSSTLSFSNYKWSTSSDSEFVKLTLTYRDRMAKDRYGQPSCRDTDYRFSDNPFCYVKKDYQVHWSSFKDLGISRGPSSYEVNVVDRWLNTHITPTTENGEVPYGTGQIPSHFRYDTGFRK